MLIWFAMSVTFIFYFYQLVYSSETPGSGNSKINETPWQPMGDDFNPNVTVYKGQPDFPH
jgi:hypothetical protein